MLNSFATGMDKNMSCVLRSWTSCAFAAALFFGASTKAEIYSFVDQDGIVHYTNVPTDKRYKKIDSDSDAKKKTGKRKKSSSKQAFRLSWCLFIMRAE